jgi:hypothetical protein
MSIRRVCLASLASVLLIGLAANCSRHGKSTAAGASSMGQIVGVFRLGDQVTHPASLKLRLELGPKAEPQEIQVTGSWSTTPTDVVDGAVLLACGLSDVKVHVPNSPSGGPNGPVDMSRAEQELALGLSRIHFFESYRPDGSASELWFPKGTNPSLGNLLIAIAGAQQVVRPGQHESAWIIEERDANGRYLAAYREISPDRYSKQKARYLESNPVQAFGGQRLASLSKSASDGATPRPTTKIERSDFELHVDSRGRLLGLRGSEVLTIDLQAVGLSLRTSVELALGDGQLTNAPSLLGAYARERANLEKRPLEQMQLDAKEEMARLDRQVLGGANFDELARALATLPAPVNQAEDKMATTLARRFEALFRLENSAPARASALMRTSQSAQAKLLLDALSLAATPSASSALGAIAKDPAIPMPLRQTAVQYLAHQPTPSDDAVANVQSLLDDRDPSLRQVARLTYGAFAALLRPSIPEQANRIGGELLARLDRAATGSSDQLDILMALANAGEVKALPVLRRLLTTGQPLRVRTNAIEALRGIDSPEVDPLLIPALRGREETSLRLAALRAIRARAIGPYAAEVAEVARKDPDPQVRSAAVSLLGDRMHVLPTLRPVLEEVRKNDSTAGNRDLANRYLARVATDRRAVE